MLSNIPFSGRVRILVVACGNLAYIDVASLNSTFGCCVQDTLHCPCRHLRGREKHGQLA